jgi:hypothetical protein
MMEDPLTYKNSVSSLTNEQIINLTLLKNSVSSNAKDSTVHNVSFTEQQGIYIVGSPMYKEKYQVTEPKCRRIAYQLTMFSITFLNYAILHATRSAWSIASSDLTSYYGFSTSTIADMNATFLFFYSLGGIFLGHLADKYGKSRLIFCQYSMIALV